MNNKYLLGLDNGGSDIKCALFDLEGNEISVASKQLRIDTPEPGFTQRDCEKVFRANIEVIREAIRDIDPADIMAVGITAYGNGMVLVDENMNPVYPAIVSTDNRASDLVEHFKKTGIERKLFPYTRQSIWSAQPLALLPWFKQNDPTVLEKTRWILSLKDYLRYRFSGKLCGELTEASSTGLMNLDTKKYDPYIFETVGISDCLKKMPEIVYSTDIAGYINKETSKLSGLKEGTPIAAGYFDIDANALASGILNDEELCLIAGTWSINEFLIKEATKDYDKKTNIATLSYIDGLYLMEDSTPTSASNFNWYIEKIIRQYDPDLKTEDIYEMCNRLVEGSDPEKSNVIFVPYLYASATHPEAKGAFLNITASDDHASLITAIYEGVVFSSVHHVHNLQRPISSYCIAKLSGGVSNSEVWSQMMADALGMEIRTLKGSQIGAKGAAIGAGVACGEFSDLKEGVNKMVKEGKLYKPDMKRHEIYKKKYMRYEQALKALDILAEEIKES